MRSERGGGPFPAVYMPMNFVVSGLPSPSHGLPHGTVIDDSSIGQLCGPDSLRPGGLQYSESMELSNDPRFFGDNVLDKRLTSFTALSVISSLIAGAACDNFFPFLDEDMNFEGLEHPWHLIRVVMQLFGFALMTGTLFLNVVATMVFGVQFYFTYRLMTSGPIGFESARGFYRDPAMTQYRQIAALGLILGLPMFLLSIGCMLYVKLMW